VQNLWHPERAVLSAATPDSHPHDRTFVVTTRRGRQVRVGMLICVRAMSDRGAALC
jgi:hypothetical protein